MRLEVRHALLRATLLAVAALGVTSATANASTSPVVGHLYVNDNATPTNTVAAFDRYADGTLSPVPGPPFAAGGAGTGADIASQGALQEAANGRYLLAVDAGSDQISVLRVEPDGGLAAVRGGVIASDGADPVSIGVHGRLVYVANAGDSDANHTGLRLGFGGRLHAIAGSTFGLPVGSQPGDVPSTGPGPCSWGRGSSRRRSTASACAA